MKTIGSRKVRENSKVASAVVAARVGGKRCERNNRVSHAHAEDKTRVAQLRAAKPGAIYGDAVKEANLHGCMRGGKRSSKEIFELSRCTYVPLHAHGLRCRLATAVPMVPSLKCLRQYLHHTEKCTTV